MLAIEIGCSPESGKHEIQPPNVLLILADDLGYGDLGCYGGQDIPTPHIDRLASEGIRFTDAHVTCSVCGPSRVSLLSGIYQQRLGCYWNPDLWDTNGWQLPDSLEILPEVLRSAGYVTGHIGKWNVAPDSRPYVDEAFDVMMWKGAYYPDEDGTYPGVDRPNFRIEPHGWGPPRPEAEYLTDRLTRHAINFIEQHQEDPFFLYLAYNAPHTPLQADIKYQEIFKDLGDEPNRIYAGMVTSMDENVGRILVRLTELGLDQNTLVIFASDNGPARGGSYIPGWPEGWPETLLGSAGPLRGHKGQPYEGGHREPFIIRWPAVLDEGGVYSELSSILDLFPTICEAAGVQHNRQNTYDGVNLLPHLSGENHEPPHDTLFWMTHNQGAVRAGDWKLIIESDTSQLLFNLQDDLAEQSDLSGSNPEMVSSLLQAWKTWSAPFPVSYTDKTKFTVRNGN
ncbi:MAG: sulfatase-like hydrolase/transferase [Cyclobacteriaceae bacterium]|nr:sulfatase-like hydrolase/transferase [Cyclobacteriaceae bacterium]